MEILSLFCDNEEKTKNLNVKFLYPGKVSCPFFTPGFQMGLEKVLKSFPFIRERLSTYSILPSSFVNYFLPSTECICIKAKTVKERKSWF